MKILLNKIISGSFISLLIIFVIIFILTFNIFNYDPIQGYDAEAHYNYVDYFSRYLPSSLNLPSELDSREFFNPPIGYVIPAFSQVICRNTLDSANLLEDCRPIYGKVTQVFQSLLFLLSIYFYLLTYKVLRSNDKLLDLNILLIIGILTVNYKTFSMIRGEPYIILFNSILLWRFSILIKNSFNYKPKDVVYFGILIGALALSRQWAFLLFPGYFIFTLFISEKRNKLKMIKFLIPAFFLGFIFSSWFYFTLYFDYGSFTSFNEEPIIFKFSNQPYSFYLPSGNEIHYIFQKPIRPYFSNQFLPILYSDLWGDYWGYFAFTSRALDVGRNQLLIGDYLARVNIVSILPSLLLIIGTFTGFTIRKNSSKEDILNRYLFIAMASSFVGYLWFLIKFPALPTGDTIKATYIIQLFHLMGLLTNSYLHKLKVRNLNLYLFWIVALILVFFHNIPASLSHF